MLCLLACDGAVQIGPRGKLSYIPNTITERVRGNRKKKFDEASSNGYHQKEVPIRTVNPIVTPSPCTVKT
jgi:hypothetical protein